MNVKAWQENMNIRDSMLSLLVRMHVVTKRELAKKSSQRNFPFIDIEHL